MSLESKKRPWQDAEFSTDLTPELNGAARSHPHPFRYMGKDVQGAAPRGQKKPEELD